MFATLFVKGKQDYFSQLHGSIIQKFIRKNRGYFHAVTTAYPFSICLVFIKYPAFIY